MFIVISTYTTPYDESPDIQIEGLFTTIEKAQGYIDSQKPECWTTYTIEEHEVQ